MNLCRSSLLSQIQEEEQREFRPTEAGPAVTISYQTGAGEHEIASRVAEILRAREPADSVP